MRAARRQVLLASAGSGKTYRLSGAYLELVAHAVAPDRILATTFTRKAAGEIARRVLQRAAEAARRPDTASALDADTGSAMGSDGWATVAVGLARRIETMRVRTIDAFFISIAQGASTAFGLPPAWRLLTEHEEAALRLEAVDRALDEGGRTETLELLRMLHAGDPQQSVRRAVADASGAGAGAFWSAAGRPEPWHALPEPEGLLVGAALHDALDAARIVDLPKTKAGKTVANWEKARQRLIEGTEANNPAYTLATKLCAALFEENGTFSRNPIEAAHREALAPLVLHARAQMVKTHHEQTSAAYALIARTEVVLERLKRERGLLTFADVPRLLGGLDIEKRMRILERLDARVEHLLLDEYQDTSLEQHALIEPILSEIASDETQSRAAVCVGDVKQALYLWREASPEILGTLSDVYPALTPEPMVKSWRTAQDVLDEVNAVFDDLTDNPAFDKDARPGAEGFAAYWESQEAARKELTGCVVLESVDASEETESGDARLKRAAACAKELCERSPGATIGVLTRVKKGVIPRLLYEMRCAGVDASEEGGNPLTDSPAVACALSALRFAQHPGDTLASFHAGTSALAEALEIKNPLDNKANRRCASRVRRLLVEDGPARVVTRWHEAVRSSLTPRDDARFAQFVELMERIEREGAPTDIPSLIERVETERVESPSGARVRVMTIHAAKGLEFDAVILCDLERRWSIQRNKVLVERDGPLGAVRAITRYPNKELREADERLAAIHAGAYRRHVLGELCGLYVAMTRAKRWLHMIVEHPKDAGTYGSTLADVVRGALAPGIDEQGVLHVSGDTECLEAIDAPGGEEGTLPIVELRLGAPKRTGSGALARRAPSGVGRADRPVSARSILAPDLRAADVGTLIHAAFEEVAWCDEKGWGFDTERVVLAVMRREPAEEIAVQGAVQRVERAMASGDVRGALSRSRYEAGTFGPAERIDLWRERPFAARVQLDADSEPVLLSGRFDRVVVGYAGGSIAWCEVLDFKSEASIEGPLEDAVEHHRAQMEAYRSALVAMTGVHPDAVRTTLVFVDRGAVVTVPQTL